MPLEEHDLRGAGETRKRSRGTDGRWKRETPFDLKRGPLIRGRLMRLQEQEHVLLVTQHHIVSDGWSMGILVGS